MSALLRRFSLKRALRFAQRKTRRAGDNLWLWAAPERNPFLQKALRVEARRKRPFFTIVGLMTAILLVNGGLWWFWNELHKQFPADFAVFGETFLLPNFLGRDVIGGVAIFTLACCTTALSLSCGTRSAQLLREEVLGGTLEQLQLLPQREERWLWMMRAHKTILALLIFACGLPIFMLAVFTGHWSFGDVFGLLLIFIVIGHAAPIWMPLQWQAAQNQGRRFDWKAWQEIVKLTQNENAALANTSIAGQLEAQRRLNKAWEHLGESAPSAESDEKAPGLLAAAPRNNNGKGSSGWVLFVGFQMLNLIIQALMRAPGTPLGAFWSNFKAALPPDARILLLADFPTLIFGLVVTWPLLIEKILLAPLPFFAFALPPLVICAPLWLARQYQGNMTLAANIALGETFWNARRLRARKTIASFSALSFCLLFLGYGWQTLIPDAALAAVFRTAPLTPMWALAALWTLAIIVATVLGGGAQEAPLKRAQNGEISAILALKQALLVMPRTLAIAVAGYFACCWLGAQSGVNSLFWQRLAPTMLTTISFWLADLSAGALLLALPEAQRDAWRALRFFWFYAPVLAALTYIAVGAYNREPFSFTQAPLVLVSPFVTLFALLREDLNFGVPWWMGLAVQLLLALFCFTIAAQKLYRAAPRLSESVEAAPLRWPLPLRWLGALFLALWKNLKTFFNGIAELSRRAEEGLVRWSARWGNPVITDEVKRRVRREHWPALWLFLPFSAAFLWWQAEWFGGSRFGPRPEIAVITLIFAGITAFLSALRLGSSFDRDRANGTLVFLFLTPLTETEIVKGKLTAALIFSFGMLLGALPFLIATTLLQWLSGDFLFPLYWLLALIFIVSAHAYFSIVNLLCAILARKPTQGAGNGFVVSVMSQMFLIGAPIFGAWIVEKYTGNFDWGSDTNAFLLILWVWTANFALTVAGWRFTIKALRKQRYSDDIVRGKGAS